MYSSPSSSSSSEDEYGVEKILDKKIIAGIPYYLIKWEGYPLSESTWEPLENLTHSQEILKEFEQGLKAAQARDKLCTPQKPVSAPVEESNRPTKILGVKWEKDRGYIYEVMWKNETGSQIKELPSAELSEYWPRLLIDYLENHVIIVDENNINSNNNSN